MTPRFTARTALALGLSASVFVPVFAGGEPARAAVGDSNVASLEPTRIAHPPTTPCTVPLFTGATFGGNAVGYGYAPPPSCPGPWAKVVLAVDLSLDAGRQYDRTGTIWLGGVNLWFGTTAEPRAALAPHWHVERDVTDDTALFETANTGSVLIANYFSAADTSTITASARLVFYPADAAHPAPRTADMVIPLTGASSATVSLGTPAATLSRTLTLPPNIERAVLDTVLQGQTDDEFWYTNVPTALSASLEENGGGAFREGELTIDGRNAGVAPVYPAIFTGGIDPLLWEPIPGVGTLDLRPFRIELTPFAGQLDTPGPHTISLSVAGADDAFSVEGTLYLYLDHGAAADSGTLTADTLGAPAPALTDTLTGTTDINGALVTRSTHAYTLAGRLATSHGVVSTTVDASSAFSNAQRFAITPSTYVQNVVQDTETAVSVTTADARGTIAVATTRYSYPLAVLVSQTGSDTDAILQTTRVAQGLLITRPADSAASLLAEGILSEDTVPFIIDPTTGGVSVGANTGAASAGAFASDGGFGCAKRVLASRANVLQLERSDTGCVPGAALAVRAMVAAIAH